MLVCFIALLSTEPTMKLLLACVCAVLATCVLGNDDPTQQMIDRINSKKTTWKAGWNFDHNTPRSYLQQLAGVRPDYEETAFLAPNPDTDYGTITIPDYFDAREAWPDCPSIGRIMDQSRCGSCWAVSVAEVLTDRLCIHKNEHFNVSAEDLLSCCKDCGRGCSGGYPQQALQYFVDEGIVSGGYYGSNKGCKPYSVGPCQRDATNSCDLVPTPKCVQKCRNGYPKTYSQDKKSGRLAYQVESDVRQIQKDIMRNGPVQASFKVYADFFRYESGVYQHVEGRQTGGHAVKIIGWGEDNGVNYWLVANSWGKRWGDHGFFKILRGTNEVQFENQINAAIP